MIVRRTLVENEVRLPQFVELFLELYPKEDKPLYKYGGYYLVDHEKNTVFWATEVDTADIKMEGKINPSTFSDRHLSEISPINWKCVIDAYVSTELQLTMQYWCHVEAFPIESCMNIDYHQEKLIELLSFMYIGVSKSIC